MSRIVLRLVTFLCSVAVATADPMISEFMASNQNSITDEDGNHSDWIEIRNPDATPVNMAGWSLTELQSNLRLWTFPAVTIPAKGVLLIFASGKDRKVVGQPLHTSFDLKASGEYLALVKPDGSTIATEFAPFPQQYPDVSYGTSLATTNLILVDKPTACRAIAPADNSLGFTWRQSGFNDNLWTAGTFGVGYFNSNANPNLSADLGVNLASGMSGTGRSSYSRASFNITNASQIQKLTLRMNYDDGFAAFINGSHVVSSPNAPDESTLTYNTLVSSHGPGAYEDFDITGKISALVNGSNVLAIQGMNTNATSSDAFVLPQLIAQVDSGGAGVTGYFTVATPGAPNGGTDTIQLPQTIQFSRPSGTFTATFNLTLSGAIAGQELRYVIADPTGSPGANIPEPTLTSTLYTGPISIASSKLIRAAVFNAANNQKGRTSTAQFLLLETGATNNTSNFSSNLPIVVMDDHGAGQPVDSSSGTHTTTMVQIFEPTAGTATLNSTPALFARSGTRIRGSSSAGFPKKSYALETWNEQNGDLDQSLLGLAADSDWIMNGPWQFDDTFINNAYVNELSRQMGRWAPRTKFCEVFFNQNGGKLDYADYAGIYVLTEKIKSSKDRLDISSIRPEDIAGDALTGGYIIKIDRPDSGEVTWGTTNGVPLAESGQSLVITEPDPDEDRPEQISYIQNYVQQFDTTLFNERNAGFTTRNYRNFIDVPQWLDHHILNSLAYNVDGLRLSAYFYKDRGQKLAAGPLWDFDRALNSDDGRDDNPQSWNNIGYFFTQDWWGPLFQDKDFVQAWIDRWRQLRSGLLSNANLQNLATSMGNEIGNAAGARDAARWPDNAPPGGVYQNEITAFRNYVTTRANWIDSLFPAVATSSLQSGVVTAGTTVTLGGGGSIYYTTSGLDPRASGGGLAAGALLYTGAITINQTTVLTVRRQVTATSPFPGATSTTWSPPITLVYLVNEVFAVAGDIAVTEVNYHPLGPTAAESAAIPGITSSSFEFIELQNIGGRTVNTFELSFPDTVPFASIKLSARSLAPGDRAFVVKNRGAFTLRYGSSQNARIIGEWTEGSLDDNGETIQLVARDGSTIQTFAYDDSGDWPGRADGKGSTLEYKGLTFSNADFANPLNWRSSSEIHGTPGTAGSGPDTRIVINEVLSNPQLPYVDSIELRNNSASAVNVGRWYLSNVQDPEDENSFKQYTIASSTSISPSGYLVFDETNFNPNGSWNPNPGVPAPTEFSLDGYRDSEVWLIEADASGKPLKFVDHAEFGPARLNESWGRWPNATGSLYPMAQRTLVDESSGSVPKAKLGAPNTGPRVGPLVLHEIHHSPVGGNTDLEFVEIHNPTASTVSLDGWRLRGAVDFNFGPTDTLAAGQVIVVVPFAATNTAKANAFRLAYNISMSVLLVGPWSDGDHLATSGYCVLYRADTPPPGDPGFHPLTIEDEVAYASNAGWPNTISGLSLNRRGTTTWGDSNSSWKGDVPSPGSLNVSYAAWAAYYYPSGITSDADTDGDGASTGEEYGFGTNPLAWEDQGLFAPVLTTQTAGGQTDYLFTYTKPRDRNATYTVEKSGDLTTWTSVPDSVVSTTIDAEVRRAVVPISPGMTTLFLRLKITTP
jgi:CotH kinase protein/Lamin Tail Domain/Chitobiase/beta-hexosaminidase C-terminal domain